jgi:hypothetical protein
MKKTIIALSLFLGVFLVSCNDEQEVDEKGIQLDPHGSINVEISTQHFSEFDVITTSKVVHDNFGGIVKTCVSYDTVPSLGPTKDTLNTGRTYTDQDEEEHEIDTIITHPKDYQFYISVKK